MKPTTAGIHHITAITSDAQKNLDFYTRVLGLRFIKLAVNLDDPSSYHLFYSNGLAEPGSDLTFFVWPGGSKGREGVRQATSVALAIAEAALAFWVHRLTHFGIPFEKKKGERFSDNYLTFKDPDGLRLELVADNAVRGKGWVTPEIAAEVAVQGFFTVTLWEDGFEATHDFLTETLGATVAVQAENVYRYAFAPGGLGRYIDVRSAPDFWQGASGTGTVHHVALRAESDDMQTAWRELLAKRGANVTPIIDRKYFHSIYFHEPGGVLLEIATEGPGFTVDEPFEQLGKKLQLPAWYEPFRDKIEAALPKLVLPI